MYQEGYTPLGSLWSVGVTSYGITLVTESPLADYAIHVPKLRHQVKRLPDLLRTVQTALLPPALLTRKELKEAQIMSVLYYRTNMSNLQVPIQTSLQCWCRHQTTWILLQVYPQLF